MLMNNLNFNSSMSKENSPFNFEDMMKELDQKTSKNTNKPKGDYVAPDLVKKFMAADSNHGTYYLLPVAEKDTNRPLLMLDKVLEIKMKIGNYDKTIRIAEKGNYSNLKDADSKESILFNEIQSMAQYLRSNDYNYQALRFRNYTLMFAYVVAQFDVNQTYLPGSYPAMFIMNDATIRTTYNDTVKNKFALTKSTNFLAETFNRESANRNKLLKLNYKRPQNYVSSMSFETINEDYLGLTGGLTHIGFDPKYLESSFTSLFNELFRSNNMEFDYDLHIKVRDGLKLITEKFNLEVLAPNNAAVAAEQAPVLNTIAQAPSVLNDAPAPAFVQPVIQQAPVQNTGSAMGLPDANAIPQAPAPITPIAPIGGMGMGAMGGPAPLTAPAPSNIVIPGSVATESDPMQ